jgi:hypothetical protein
MFGKRIPGHRRRRQLLAVAAALAATACPALRAEADNFVTITPVDPNGYGRDDLNAVAVARNTICTVGGYQYLAYYDSNVYNSSGSSATIQVARRVVGSTSWSILNTGITIATGSDNVATDSIIYNGIDDHDVVAMAVDGNGYLHLSWGMHNHTLNYDISSAPVNTAAFTSTTLVQQTAANNPALFANLGSINQVTYPEFYYEQTNGVANGNLLFDYRDAASASGGGSGNGNTFFTTYNATSKSFVNNEMVLNGGATSVNGYQNQLTYDSKGNLLMTWTWRGTTDYQSNYNILFAQSPDNGVTWYQQGGTNKYTLGIVAAANQSNGATPQQVAQVVKAVATGSSLINQTSMTVDLADHPLIATWYTPNGNSGSAVSSANNPNRQYMLVYYDGTSWRSSQISDRVNDAAFDTTGDDVRNLGRPLVLVDKQDRVLVVTRSDDVGLHGLSVKPATAGDNLVVYWNTVASLDSATPAAWQTITLDSANLGEFEPSYDPQQWAATNTLSMLYEPVGQTAETTETVSVLDWDEAAYFASPEPGSLTLLGVGCGALLGRRRRAHPTSRLELV